MNSTKQTSKFSRFMKNNAALLLIIFCVVAIGIVVLAVTLTKPNNVLPDDNVVVNPNPNPTPTPGDSTDDPVVTPPESTTQIIKVYFVSPLNYTSVTMDYTDGQQLLFVFNQTLNSWKTHSAVDLAATDGAAVVSMFDGIVIDVDESYGMGGYVTIDHGNNIIATYASLSNIEVVKGQEVSVGEQIGTVGTTASYEFLDGAHLHLEVKKDGKVVNPMPYVNGEVYFEKEVPAENN